jgi:hypothetical protein
MLLELKDTKPVRLCIDWIRLVEFCPEAQAWKS